jgi:hypothetical protein
MGNNSSVNYISNEDLKTSKFKTGGRYEIQALNLKIYPLKYSLVDSNSRTHVADAGGLPAVSGKNYALTPLRPGGWLFLHDVKKNTWREYKIKENGSFQGCLWKKLDQDVRPPNDVDFDHLELEYEHTYEILVTETQLSWQQYKKLYDSADERQKRMQKIDPAEYRSKNKHKNLFTALQIHDVFDFDNAFTNHSFDKRLVERNDVCYFALNDPLFIADQLRLDISIRYMKMESIIQSLQLGRSPDDVYAAMLKKTDLNSLQDPHVRQELEALFRLSSSLYRFGYAEKENEDKFGGSLHKERIEKLIASGDRKDERQRIAKCKEKLLNYLKTTYYLDVLDAYLDNIPLRLLAARARLSLHIEPLAVDSDAKDKLLNLEKTTASEEYKKIDKTCVDYLTDILDARNKLGKIYEKICPIKKAELMAKDENTNEEISELLSVPVAQFLTVSLEKTLHQFSRLIEKSERFMPVLIRRLNAVQIVDGAGSVLIAGFFEQVDIRDYIPTKFKRIVKPDKYRIINAPAVEKTFFIASETDIIPVKQIGFTQIVEHAFENRNSFWEIMHKIAESKTWNYFVAGLSYINLLYCISELLKTPKNKLETFKAYMGLAGALSEVWASTNSLMYIKKMAAGASEEILEQIGLRIARINAVATFIGAGISAIDAGINFYEGDIDAGIAYGCSAILGILLGVALWNSWHPGVIILLALAGIAALIFAVLLEDPPLERFIKNCPLRQEKTLLVFNSDVIDFKGEPWHVAKNHYDKRETLYKHGFEEWRRGNDFLFSLVYRELEDMFYTYRVQSSAKKEYLKKETFLSPTTAAVVHIKFECFLNLYDPSQSELEFQLLYFLTEEIKPYGYTEIPSKGNVVISMNAEKRIIAAIEYDIPKKLYTDPKMFYSTILLLTRIKYSKELTYPIPEGTEQRYIGVKNSGFDGPESQPDIDISPSTNSSMYSSGMNLNLYAALNTANVWGDRVRIGTKAQLLNNDYWKR